MNGFYDTRHIISSAEKTICIIDRLLEPTHTSDTAVIDAPTKHEAVAA